MRRVAVVSPFAGDVGANISYLRACLRDCFKRGEAPFASHAIYPAALDDEDPTERALGMKAGIVWLAQAEAVVAYMDRGFSKGMLHDLLFSLDRKLKIELRKLEGGPLELQRDDADRLRHLQDEAKRRSTEKRDAQVGMIVEAIKAIWRE